MARVLSTAQLFAEAPEFAVLAIDVPIGLPDDGPRAVDIVARRLLGAPRASSVFPAPVRAALNGVSYSDASALSFAACGKRLSRQAYAIIPKIREVDSAMRAAGDAASRVREVHPEVCFYYLNNLSPMRYSKRKALGLSERLARLEGHFRPIFAELRASVDRRAASSNDIADALVALWSAERIRAGSCTVLRGEPLHDSRGLRMEMVA